MVGPLREGGGKPPGPLRKKSTSSMEMEKMDEKKETTKV